MEALMTWVNLGAAFAFGTKLTSTQQQNLRDNIAAAFAKDGGAPQLAALYVVQAMIANGAVGVAKHQLYAAGDIAITGSAGASAINTSLQKKAEYLIGVGGEFRVPFTLRTSGGGGGTAYGQIYKNGSPIGILRSTTNESPQSYEEDFSGIVTGDLIQLYSRTNLAGRPAITAGFELKVDYTLLPLPQAV
jgi:hypothetical protein